MSVSYANNAPQSMLSSRVYTNNMLKLDDTSNKKPETVTRSKIVLNSTISADENRCTNKEGGIDQIKNKAGAQDKAACPNKNNTNTPQCGELVLKRRTSEELDQINIPSDKKNNQQPTFDEKIIVSRRSSWLIYCSRCLYSRKTISFYIALMVISVIVFIYSIYGYFAQLDELPILISEICLTVIVCSDMIVRICVTGFSAYFKKWLNWLDAILVVLSAITIILYVNYHNLAQRIEDVSFALLIIVRNSSQVLRMVILFRNEKEVRVRYKLIYTLYIYFI